MKTLILTIATAALLSLTTFGNAAEAGGRGITLNFGHKLGNFKARPTRSAHRRAKIAAARKAKAARIRKAKIAAAKKAAVAKKRRVAALKRRAAARRAQEQEVANTETKTDETNVATEDDNKEIVVAEAGEIETNSSDDRKLSCKKYIPSAGMTITVPCND